MGETQQNNPFDIGTGGHHIKSLTILCVAKELYNIRNQRAFHSRALHYYLVNEAARGRRIWPVWVKSRLDEWQLYENDDTHSQRLSVDLGRAVRMGYVPSDWVTNKKCPEWTWGLGKWNRECSSLQTTMSPDGAPFRGAFNRFNVTTGPFSDHQDNEDFFDQWAAGIAKRFAEEAVTFHRSEFDQPFHLVVVSEKAGMDEDIILPVCRRFNADYVSFGGNFQYHRFMGLVRYIGRLPVERPVRIFYLTDFDSSGVQMADSMAPDMLHRFPDRDIKLFWMALKYEQVVEFDLPRKAEKGKEKGQKTQVDNFEKKYGRGATELNALGSLQPQALRDIVVNALEPYYDGELEDARLEERRIRREEIEQVVLEVLQSSRDRIVTEWEKVLQIRDRANEVYKDSGLENLLDEIDSRTGDVSKKFHTTVKRLGLDETREFDPRDGKYPDEDRDVLDDIRLKIPAWQAKTDSRHVTPEEIHEAFLKISPEMAEWAVEQFLTNQEGRI